MDLSTPPGFYYVSSFRRRLAEASIVETLVRAHVTSICSVHDIAESLASDLLAKFPAANGTEIRFYPAIRTSLKIENLGTAHCCFSKVNTRMRHSGTEQNGIYTFFTEWRVPISLQSGLIVSLKLRTEERSESRIYNQTPDEKSSSDRSSIKSVHPTFGLHEEIAKFAEKLESDSGEGAALLLAQLLFHLGDKQSPCKRLQVIRVMMREVRPVMEASRTKNEHIDESLAFVTVTLGRDQYEQSRRSLLSSDAENGLHRAYLALGSNLGNRVETIESALREMSDRGLIILRTSALYETKPMYLENQEAFINGACEVCGTDASLRQREC